MKSRDFIALFLAAGGTWQHGAGKHRIMVMPDGARYPIQNSSSGADVRKFLVAKGLKFLKRYERGDERRERRETVMVMPTSAPVAAPEAPKEIEAPKPPPKALHDAIREARVAEGMTTRAMADVVGVSEYTIYAWERGAAKPTVESWRRLCDLFPSLRGMPTPEGLSSKKVKYREPTAPAPEAPLLAARVETPARTDYAALGAAYGEALAAVAQAEAALASAKHRAAKALDVLTAAAKALARD